MLDEKRIRLMTKLAKYEQRQGKEELRISRYYRSDFIGLALLKNFVLTTLGYGAVVGLFFACQGDDFLEQLEFVQLLMIIIITIAGYIIALVCYSGAVYIVSSVRYTRAQKDMKLFDEKLAQLEQYYEEMENPEKRQEDRRIMR